MDAATNAPINQITPDISARDVILGGDLSALAAREKEFASRVSEDGNDIDALNHLGVIKLYLGYYEPAKGMFMQSLRINPNQSDIYLYLGYAQHKIGDLEQAIACMNDSLRRNPEEFVGYQAMGQALFDRGLFENAIKVLSLGEKLAPNEPTLISVKSAVLLAAGDKEALLEYCNERIEQYPLHGDLLRVMAAAGALSPEDPRVARVEDALERGASPIEMHHSFTLGNVYHRAKQYDKAFEYFQRGGELSLKQANMTPARVNESVKQFFDGIEAAFTPENTEETGWPKATARMVSRPIFIVGEPRSGTSLVEQILASHSQVYGAGELNYIPNFCRRDVTRVAGDVYPNCMSRWPEISVDAVNDCVREIAVPWLKRNVFKPDASYITDKLPNNFQYLGIIRQLFPNAIVIHCHRNPMDNCLSMFQQHFMGSLTHTYNLDNLAYHYARYLKVMALWKARYPGWIYDAEYEAITGNPEPEIRALLEHVGLPWEDAVLEPHKTKRDTRTASAAQVTEPIYSTSSGRWKKYEQQLQPLKEKLEEYAGITID